MTPPYFSFGALATAQRASTSEARPMYNFAVDDFEAKPSCILLEEMSATTEENAASVNVMLKRSTFTGMQQKIGVLALLHHLPRALTIFKTAFTDFEIQPVIAEDLLATKGSNEIDKIAKYYAPLRGNKQYDTRRIRELLTEGTSLAEMME